jgi:AcrR family transcriptional regulator
MEDGHVATRQPRSAKGRARRAQIVQAASALFGSRGYRAVTLRDIAEAAGISHQNLLYYFPTKDELLQAVLEERDAATSHLFDDVKSLAEWIAIALQVSRANAEAPGLLASFTITTAEATDPEHPAHQYYQNRYELFESHVAPLFEAARRAGSVRADIDPRMATRLLLAIQDGLQLQWLFDKSAVDMHGMLAHALQLFQPYDEAGGDGPQN